MPIYRALKTNSMLMICLTIDVSARVDGPDFNQMVLGNKPYLVFFCFFFIKIFFYYFSILRNHLSTEGVANWIVKSV